MKRVCKICGETEQEHHDPDWLEIQDRCVCDWREWDYDKMERLPPVCEEFVGDERYGCQRCEHDNPG